MNVPELLQIWRDAIRAAERADQLAATAAHVVENADIEAEAAAELATLAEAAAAAANRAAERARAVADSAAAKAKGLHMDGVVDAKSKAAEMRKIETDAASAYHSAEEDARGTKKDRR